MIAPLAAATVAAAPPAFPPPQIAVGMTCAEAGGKLRTYRLNLPDGVEAPPGPTTDREITCLSFGGPLHGREGRFLLKYFMIERPKRRAANR